MTELASSIRKVLEVLAKAHYTHARIIYEKNLPIQLKIILTLLSITTRLPIPFLSFSKKIMFEISTTKLTLSYLT